MNEIIDNEQISLVPFLQRLATENRFTEEEMCEVVSIMLNGAHSEIQIAALLFGMTLKGETSDELIGAVHALRRHAVSLPLLRRPDLDTAGTGGDGSHSLNLSTAAAIVAAGAGITVAKHGNRAASSRCGSADILQALGIIIDPGPAATARAIETLGIGFLFAPAYHPTMKRVANIRRTLGVPTLFNMAGPLANPANVRTQLIGVPNPSQLTIMGETVRRLGTERALIVTAEAGIDEVSPEGVTIVMKIVGNETSFFRLTAEDFGLNQQPLSSIRGSSPAENATAIEKILSGDNHSARTAVLLNSAAAIVASGLTENFTEASHLAAVSVDSGAAFAKLNGLRAMFPLSA